MSSLLEGKPYTSRDAATFIREMNELTLHHLAGCPEFRNLYPRFEPVERPEDLPFLHVGLFKHLNLRTESDEIQHQRTLKSSATGSGVCSQIVLDQASSDLQSTSTLSILRDFVGDDVRPLMILDSSRSLRARGEMSARIAAALSLRPLASEIHFLLEDASDPKSMKWEVLLKLLDAQGEFLVYGFTWMLWLAWGAADLPVEVREALAGKRIHFIHSGGWKKLESLRVNQQQFNERLLERLHPDSRVIDFYGLVEQVGIIYPLCEAGYRHVPAWADVLVRDSWTLESLVGQPGQLQLMNTLARGAPYHNVLTEDMGEIVPGDCDCGRAGKRFTLLGRVPKAEVRGCANV